MNKKYILKKIEPYLNSEGKLREADFNYLFSGLNKQQQYKIIDILIEEDIEIDYDKISVETPRRTVTQVKQANTSPASSFANINKLTNEQLCVLYQQGDTVALEALVIKNKKLVWSRVIKYSGRYKHKLDEEDLFQYGSIGLMKAVRKFDVKKETKFTTYAIWWIDQQILRSIADYGFTVRIPVHYFEQVNKLNRILNLNPEASKQEIFELLAEDGMTEEKFEEILQIKDNILSLASLNNYVGDDEDSELGDFIIDHHNPSLEEQVENLFLKKAVDIVLKTLKEREQDVLVERFGLTDGIYKTLEQVGMKYNVTRERIRQIESQAIKKLRHPSRSNQLRDFFYRG